MMINEKDAANYIDWCEKRDWKELEPRTLVRLDTSIGGLWFVEKQVDSSRYLLRSLDNPYMTTNADRMVIVPMSCED